MATVRSSQRALRLLSLAALALSPGCFFTSGVWDWAEDKHTVVDARVERVDGWTAEREGTPDEGFDVRVRWTDGSTTVERVGPETEGSPANLVRRARSLARERHHAAQAAWLLRLATTRGWPRRDFGADEALAPLEGQPDFATACAAPITSPTFFFGPPPSPRKATEHLQDLWLQGSADKVMIIELEPKAHGESGPLGYVLAVLVTPLTIALDVVSFPVQVVFVVMLGRALAGAGQH